MTGGTYDFTDRFYARALQYYHARQGMDLVRSGKRKEAREHLDQAIHWEHEVQRIEAAIHRQRKRLEREPVPSDRALLRSRQPS